MYTGRRNQLILLQNNDVIFYRVHYKFIKLLREFEYLIILVPLLTIVSINSLQLDSLLNEKKTNQ